MCKTYGISMEGSTMEKKFQRIPRIKISKEFSKE
jgi:hypothetical protein